MKLPVFISFWILGRKLTLLSLRISIRKMYSFWHRYLKFSKNKKQKENFNKTCLNLFWPGMIHRIPKADIVSSSKFKFNIKSNAGCATMNVQYESSFRIPYSRTLNGTPGTLLHHSTLVLYIYISRLYIYKLDAFLVICRLYCNG